MGFEKQKVKTISLQDISPRLFIYLHQELLRKSKREVELELKERNSDFRRADCVIELSAAHWDRPRHIHRVRRIEPEFIVHFPKGTAHPHDAAHWVCAWHTEPQRPNSSSLHQNSIRFNSFVSK